MRERREGVRVDPDQDWVELVAQPGVNPADVVAWTRAPDGQLVWLGQGDEEAGLRHIVKKHKTDFENVGILSDELPDFLVQVVREGVLVAMQGTRPVYRVRYGGQDWHVAVTVGDNGFIVGSNPVGQRKLRQLLRRQNASTRPPTS